MPIYKSTVSVIGEGDSLQQAQEANDAHVDFIRKLLMPDVDAADFKIESNVEEISN